MAALIERLVAAAVPPQQDPEHESHARFFVRAWLWATPVIVVLGIQYAANGMRLQAANQVLSVLVGAGLVFAFRLGMPMWLLREGSLGWMVLSFAITALGQTPWDLSSLTFFVLVPLGSAFVTTYRHAARWTVVSAVTGLTVLVLGTSGFTWPDADPQPAVTTALNFLFTLVLSLVFAATYAEERERALVKVRAADRAKSVFLANVSHEIRTPMNGIVGMTELLLKTSLSAEQRAQLEVVQRSGSALVLLINDLLDLARMEEGRFELTDAAFEPRALGADIVRLYQPLAAEQGLALSLSVAPDVPVAVRGDALRLRQVLSNLLSNAVKFTARGEVRLLITRDGERTRFAVEDTGPGISADLRARLFQRFEQGDGSARRRAGGTGLGLALSHDFVARMGGALELDAHYGPGARFHFSLQLPVEEAAAAPVKVVSLEGLGAGRRVLVVDDNPINLAVARGLLSRAGFEVATETNGRAAVERVQAAPWSLVLMDLQMPDMDGLEAARCIRALPGDEGRVPIVALTASAMPEDVAACRAAGMNDVLAKPIDLRSLAGILQQVSQR